MTWKKITLTDAIVDDIAFYLGREYLIPGRPEVTTYPPRADTMDAWRIITAVLSHPDAAGLFECDYTDYVHVDEAARRVEAAREQGWDEATLWIDSYQGGPNGRTSSARSANPYRPVQELPAEYDGAVLVPAERCEAITTTEGQEFARLTFTTKQDLWYGPNLAARPGDWVIQTTVADRLTPGTWRTV